MSLYLPRTVFGSSALGNLYGIVPDSVKRDIVARWFREESKPVIDSAGKYGAGLALESIARFLEEARVDPASVQISNKLGWKRVLLTSDEPTFEPGAWFGLEHDAEQCISYDGILECYEQGNALLGKYRANLVSVHDPDEYLADASTPAESAARYQDVLGAYQALVELREQGQVAGVGVGSKDWRVIKRLFNDGVPLDWVMLANSLTLYTHPPEVLDLLDQLDAANVAVINSAVFNAGFLIGGKYFDYQVITPAGHSPLFAWRDRFLTLCNDAGIKPAHACCQFALSPPAISALALNSSSPEHVTDNVSFVSQTLPPRFWQTMKEQGLLAPEYPYL